MQRSRVPIAAEILPPLPIARSLLPFQPALAPFGEVRAVVLHYPHPIRAHSARRPTVQLANLAPHHRQQLAQRRNLRLVVIPLRFHQPINHSLRTRHGKLIERLRVQLQLERTQRTKSTKKDTAQAHLGDLSHQVQFARDTTQILLSTTSRVVSAMPVVVDYPATLHSIRQVDKAEGVSFVTNLWTKGSDHTEQNWKVEHLDAYKIRDEFLKVTTPRQALDFLRETGSFLPDGADVSWIDFRRWQRFAETAIEHTKLVEFMEASFSQKPTEKLDPSGELKQISLMLTGIYPHSYFGDSKQSLSTEDSAKLRRSVEITSENLREAERNYREILESIEKGQAHTRDRQRTLETWFYEPPDFAYSIKFIPKNPDEKLFRNIRRGGALVDYLHPREDLAPILVIKPACTCEAIAAAIYADRLAGVQSEKCPGCGHRFEVGSQKNKTYCSDKCRERLKKRRRRKPNNKD
jgi:predicted nucleic acid-binding Zn ribbon protein